MTLFHRESVPTDRVSERKPLRGLFPGITLIAWTGWGQEEGGRRAKAAGFDRHLTRPVRARVLEDLPAAADRPATAGAGQVARGAQD